MSYSEIYQLMEIKLRNEQNRALINFSTSTRCSEYPINNDLGYYNRQISSFEEAVIELPSITLFI